MLTPTSTPAPAQASAQAELRPASATPAPTATAVTTPTPAATSVPTPTSVAAPESTPTSVTPAPTPARTAYDSTEIMNEVSRGLTYSFGFLEDALDRIDERNDTSMAPVLIEIVRFMPTPAGRERVGETLRTLTGQQFPADDWGLWMEWLGNNLEAFQPPSGYADWKADLYSLIDRRFAGFIRPAGDFSKIDLTEVVWGGVVPDGIPDLRNPPFVEAQNADYMEPDDRVFGVHINGDAKAYPLRIVNAHEMVNDWIGGEPISLMW